MKGDRRRSEYKDWAPWLAALSALVAEFDNELSDDPLSYNETASVSLLAGAAARAGYLGIAEFSVVKGRRMDLRRAAIGRCDFWMSAKRNTYGFEFKQLNKSQFTLSDWSNAMRAADECASCLRPSEADVRVSGLIVSLWHHEPCALDGAISTLKNAATECDFAWRISGVGAEASDAFLFFNIVGC